MRRLIKIEELGRIITGSTPPTNKSEYFGKDYLFIKPSDINKESRITYNTETKISEAGAEVFKTISIPKGSTCVVCIGSIGEKLTYTNCLVFTNQQINSIIPNVHFDNKYVFYLIKNNLYKLKAANQGSSSGRENVSKRTFGNIVVEIEDSIVHQKKISSILSAYDDLIENNQKQIKLLEEAAQRLYKEWFVDLRFPGHENVKIVDGVPEGWEKTTLDDVIEFNPSISLSKERIKEFVPMSALSTSAMTLDLNEISSSKTNSGSRFQNDDTIMARITPCLENGKIAFVQELQSEEGAVGSTEYIVMRSKSLCPPMVYLLARTHSFRQYAINSMSGSDGRQRVKVERLREYEYLKPDATLIEKFSGNVTPFFKKIKDLSKANIVLQEARDRLLPKLMSGEIEV